MTKDTKYVLPDVGKPLHFDRKAMGSMLIKQSNMLYMSQVEQGRLEGYSPSGEIERGPTSTGWAWDAEFLDFDHDGDDDLYVVNGTNDFNTFSMVYRRFHDDGSSSEHVLDHRRESNVFFENESGKLRNVSDRSGADLTHNARSTAYLDVDADGDLDIVTGNQLTDCGLLLNDGAGTFADATAASMPGGAHEVRGMAVGDVDGDGDADVVAGNSAETNKLYLNDGTAAAFSGATVGTAGLQVSR